ncbi:uncharacterized protein LOC142317581 [Lycorma delicatula]|uniref:uncharacterized protein LOC142317581 n=1 Tax=Lycorma delicatula TaxID=130591 RepID=UPI003F512C6F
MVTRVINMITHVTQLMTGRGNFESYLYGIGRWELPECMYCDARDTVEHRLFHCSEWEEYRGRAGISGLEPENLTAYMLNSEDNWRAVEEFARATHRAKEAEDRRKDF